MPPLYVDDEGRSIVTNSMLTTWNHCPKQTEYKYDMRLQPKLLGKPLSRGKWVHELLEIHGQGGDWKDHHRRLSAKFAELLDEEKDYYGDLPREIGRVMVGYFWHYKYDPWKVLESEVTLECELPDGTIFRCKVDWLIENQFGLWLVDHKTHKTLPDLTYRMLDTQAPRYIYCAQKNGIPVNGFIWNYLRWKAPTVPQLLKDGTRLSKRAIDTDYPTVVRAMRKYGLDPAPYQAWIDSLKAMQYRPGEPQSSPFFYRSVFEKQPDLIARMEKSMMRSVHTMNNYDFSDPDAVERNVSNACRWRCSYQEICSLELLVGRPGVEKVIKQNFKVGDVLSYYQDRAGEIPEKE